MPIHFTFAEELGLFYVMADGRPTGRQFTNHMRQMAQAFRLHPNADELIDLQSVQPLRLKDHATFDGLMFSRRRLRAAAGPHRIACVVGSEQEETTFRVFVQLLGDVDAQVFLTLDEALAWLNRPDAAEKIHDLRDHLLASQLSGDRQA